MVKADSRRNYYADLELSPTADTEEIKKQFRKLGTSIVLSLYLIADRSQLDCTTQIATQAKRWNMCPSFKQFRRLTKY